VVLRYFSELTIPEVASVTGKQEGTIKIAAKQSVEASNEILLITKHRKKGGNAMNEEKLEQELRDYFRTEMKQ